MFGLLSNFIPLILLNIMIVDQSNYVLYFCVVYNKSFLGLFNPHSLLFIFTSKHYLIEFSLVVLNQAPKDETLRQSAFGFEIWLVH